MQDSNRQAFDALMADAIAASQANDAVRAIEGFQNASALLPGASLPQFMLGSEYAALGDMVNAETALANATRLAPDFPLARYQLGLLQFSSGRAAVALLTWQPLLDLSPTDPLPHFVRGFAALAQDQFDDALACYAQGLALEGSNKALSSDIQKVIDGIHALPGRSGGSPAEHKSPSGGAGEDSEDSLAHVLLANYGQQGRMH